MITIQTKILDCDDWHGQATLHEQPYTIALPKITSKVILHAKQSRPNWMKNYTNLPLTTIFWVVDWNGT